MAYGSPLGVSVPTVSVTAGPEYATTINEFLNALKAVVEAKVTPGGMDMSTDLSFLSGGNSFRVKDLRGSSYTNMADLLTTGAYPRTLFFYNNELYVNTGSNQIQLTTGGAINVSSTGAITGTGYGASGVEVNWDSGNLAYKFKSASGTDAYADVVCDDLKLNDGSGNFITLVSPALASDLSFTLPSAMPGTNNSVLTCTTAGVLAASATPTVTTITTTGAATVGGALTSTGLITAQAGVTADDSQHITVSGTGLFKHGSRGYSVPGSMFRGSGGVADPTALTYGYAQVPSDGTYYAAVVLPVAARVLSVTLFLTTSVGVGTRRGYLRSKVFSSAATADVLTTSTSASTSTDVSLTVSGTATIGSGTIYTVAAEVFISDIIRGFTITYDQP